jgi:hypothetical protein
LYMRRLPQQCERVAPANIAPDAIDSKPLDLNDQEVSGCFELDDVETVYSFWRVNTTSELKRKKSTFAIPTWLLPLAAAFVCLVCYYLPVISVTSEGPISHLQLEASNTLFLREMESGAWFERLGDLEQAIACYDRAAVLPHDQGVDRERLIGAIEKILKSKGLSPKMRIALGEKAARYRRHQKE